MLVKDFTLSSMQIFDVKAQYKVAFPRLMFFQCSLSHSVEIWFSVKNFIYVQYADKSQWLFEVEVVILSFKALGIYKKNNTFW